MAGSTITGTVTQTVVLGRHGYPSPLTLTDTAGVSPSAYGAYGIIDPAGVLNGRIVNMGHVYGGYGGYGGGDGGVGIDMKAVGSIDNTGVVHGGNGGYGYFGGGGGGYGIQLGGGSLVNRGTIAGGNGGGANYGLSGDGAAGVVMENHASLVNRATITGGAGGPNYYMLAGYHGGGGGAGVYLQGGMLTNAGDVTGGAGGTAKNDYTGGGGTGVIVTGGTLVAGGTIAGGAAGNYASGGVGVTISDATVIASGTIAGGIGDYHGDAVSFGTVAGTLVVDPGAVFLGDIVGNSAVADVLGLGGTQIGTLSGLGSSITGMTDVKVENHAHWLLQGNIIGSGTLTIGNDASLALNGQVDTTSTLFGPHGGGLLVLDIPTAFDSEIGKFGQDDTIDLVKLVATTLKYSGGTLTLDNGHEAVATLLFAGNYNDTNFALQPDGNGGTDVVYVAAQEFGGRDAAAGQQPQHRDGPGSGTAAEWQSHLPWLATLLMHNGCS